MSGILVTMSSLIDKKILILGILSYHSIHGYKLNQILKTPALPIKIGKANAYQILNKYQKAKYKYQIIRWLLTFGF